MRMTTEEAFVKVLQMHGIEHAFGIIGSAFMPISDLFPKAGITFWDVRARDQRRPDLRRLHARDRQDGHGDRPERPRHHQLRHRRSRPPTGTTRRMLLVTPQAANKTIGQGGFQEVEQMALFRDMVCYQEEVRDPVPRRRGAEPRDLEGEAPVGAGADQHPARLLDPGDRHRAAGDRRVRAPGAAAREAIAEAAKLLSEAKFPVILIGRRRRARQTRSPNAPRWPSSSMRRSAATTSTTTAFPGSHPPGRRPARLQRLEGGDGADRQGRRGAGARHAAQSVLDAAGLRHRLLAEEREDHPGRHQCRPDRPDQAGRPSASAATPSWWPEQILAQLVAIGRAMRAARSARR